MSSLNYYTSPDEKIAPKITPAIDYHTSFISANNGFINLKKFSSKINENDIFTLAYLVNNPYISEDERNKLKDKMHMLIELETVQLKNTIDKINETRANKDPEH